MRGDELTAPEPARPRLPPFGVRGRALDFVPTAVAKDIAVEWEDLGYGVVWLPEMAGRDVFVHLTHLLTATRSMIGATGIASMWARDAVAMSCAANALAEAFPSRLIVGIGVSHKNLVEKVRGGSYGSPLASLTEYLAAMAAAPYRAVRPTQAAPRVIGALGPKMLALASQHADGAHPYLVPPEHTSRARSIMGTRALLCPDQMVVIERDRGAAREIARRRIGVYLSQPNYVRNLRGFGYDDEDFQGGGSERLVDALVATGSVDDVVRRIREHLDAGADHVSIQPLTSQPRGVPLGQWRELAPALRELAPMARRDQHEPRSAA